MRIGAHLVIGLPGENLASLWKTSEMLQALRPDYLSVNIAVYRLGSVAEQRGVSFGGLADNLELLQVARTLIYLRLAASPGWWWERARSSSPGELYRLVRHGASLAKNTIARAGRESGWLRVLRTAFGSKVAVGRHDTRSGGPRHGRT